MYSSASINYNNPAASDSWYRESLKYNYHLNNPLNQAQVGHFTQMIWKNTRRVGFGFAKVSLKGNHRFVVVANYDPPGNYMNQYLANVPRLK